MKYTAKSPQDYYDQLPEERQEPMNKLRETINEHLPAGFSEELSYGMPGWVVPHSEYPDGYHCKPEEPLPFMSIASQKNFVALYHMGIYANPDLMKWFVAEYPKHCDTKLDMGKSCIRFKKLEKIPFELIAQLVEKMDMQEWINIYESHIKN